MVANGDDQRREELISLLKVELGGKRDLIIGKAAVNELRVLGGLCFGMSVKEQVELARTEQERGAVCRIASAAVKLLAELADEEIESLFD